MKLENKLMQRLNSDVLCTYQGCREKGRYDCCFSSYTYLICKEFNRFYNTLDQEDKEILLNREEFYLV